MAKINISIDDELLKIIDQTAEQNYMSRSGLISFAAAQYVNQIRATSAISQIAISLKKIADSNDIDESTISELEEYGRLCELLLKVRK